jgi:hypothetical protein
MRDGGICFEPEVEGARDWRVPTARPTPRGARPNVLKIFFIFFYFPYEKEVFFEKNGSDAPLFFVHEKLINAVSR